ncbi:MAG: Hsp20/alpha crystallin family protein [Thermoanaerobaculia bacterium]|nr:Hsp20/alpha crystallin family protein [Thermoanaerobaculia bacterium]
MAEDREIQVQSKQEAEATEATSPGRYYSPYTDIFETEDALTVVMDMPGVDKANVAVTLEKGRLSVEGQIDSSRYDGLEPVYTEYDVGHFIRSFALSSKIDQAAITAEMEAGVLTLRLPKAPEAQPRRIEVS